MKQDEPHLKVCVWCGEKNETPNLLCPTCNARFTLRKEVRGSVVQPNG